MLTVSVWILFSLLLTTFILLLGERFGSSFVISVYTALIVMAQVFAGKLVVFGPWVVPAAVIVYAVSFLITDALNEFYGREEATKAVFSGFAGSILLVAGIQIVLAWQPAGFWEGQEAFVQTLGFTWRIVIASLISYLVSQNWDIHIFNEIKRKTRGEKLWLRNCLSTISSQFIDTILFILIAFLGVLPLNVVLGMVIGQYMVKLIIALFDTPFLYFMRLFYPERRYHED